MRFLVVGLPRSPVPPEQLSDVVAAEPQWYERHRDKIEVYGWFAGGGGFAIVNVEDDVTLNELVVQHPFLPFSEVQVRAFVDHDTGLRQLEEVVRAMTAAT
jgi:hypothetical protein